MLALVVLATVGAGTSPVAAAPPERVDICHRHTPTDSYRLMTVSARSLAAHVAHGDGAPRGPGPGEEAT